MIKRMLSFAAASALFVQSSFAMNIELVSKMESLAKKVVVEAGLFEAAPLALDWRVGEFHNFDVSLGSFGKLGTGTKSVTEDVPAQEAFWYVTEMDLMGQTQKTEALMRRSDGEILRYIVNGEEQDPGQNSGEVEIIEQKQTTTQTPAGNFDCWYIKAKITGEDGKVQMVEIWTNPVDVNLDGTLKLQAETDFGKMELLLTKFGKK